VGWTEALISNNRFKKGEEAFLVSQLDAVGPDYEDRRVAGAIGLAMAGKVERFARWCYGNGKSNRLSLNMIAVRNSGDRYMRRLLPLWDEFSNILGGDAEALERLGITAESCLGLFNPEVPNAARVFKLLHEAVPTTRFVRKDAHLAALARFEPDSDAMRDLVMPIVASDFYSARGYRTNADTWDILKAAEIFGEYFSSRGFLLQRVIDSFDADPANPGPAAALAETVLRQNNAELEERLASGAAGKNYDLATGFKVLAAVGPIPNIVVRLRWLLKRDLTSYGAWNFPYWVPSLIRRIEKDFDLAETLIAESVRAQSSTAKLSLLALAGKSMSGRITLRESALKAAEAFTTSEILAVGFDITSGSMQLASHVIREFGF
jgi:hypothetical protein